MHNYKKVSLSRARFEAVARNEESMPTGMARAAFNFLMTHNKYYEVFQKEQKERLRTGASLNLSSYDLFVEKTGIECAMYPVLYPTTDFTDTGILAHYKHVYGDNKTRICSIGLSWTRKVLSSVRAYGEQINLPFFLYEKHLAHKYFYAQVRAKQMSVTADVMARDSQSSAGYWEITQDALADLVRIMLGRCFDPNYVELYESCRKMRGDVWLCAFPNFFCTIAPAEWTFPRPYFLEAYAIACSREHTSWRCTCTGWYSVSGSS